MESPEPKPVSSPVVSHKDKSFTTISVPKTLHKRLAEIALSISIKSKKRFHIWQLINERIKR